MLLKTFTCRSELTIDIDDLVENYKAVLEEDPEHPVSIEDFVEDVWSGYDDPFYYCDNAEEIQTEICKLMREAMADGNE